MAPINHKRKRAELAPQSVFIKSELDIFGGRPIQVAIDSSKWCDLRPSSTVTENNPISFIIAGNEEEFLDPVFYVKIKARVQSSNGTSLPADSEVAPVNCFGQAMFERIDLKIQDKIITMHNYPYRAYLEHLLNYGNDAKKSQMTAEMYYKEDAGYLDSLDGKQNTSYAARQLLATEGKSINLFVRLTTDLGNQPKLLPNLVDVGLTLHQKNNPFRLMYASTTQTPRVVIEDITLFYRSVKLSDTMNVAIAETLRSQPALYPVSHVEMLSFQITKHHTLVNRETLSRGQLPKAVVVGIVDADGYNGSGTKNPFNFKSKNANFVCLHKDSDMIPHVPFTPNFSEADCVREYLSLFQVTGSLGDNCGNAISYQDYLDEGYALYGFDLSNDECGSGCHTSPLRNGNLSLEMKFNENGVAESSIAIVYMVFDKNIYIDQNRNVAMDFS